MTRAHASNELYHYGVRGQKWGDRNFQNEDGSYKAPAQRENGGHGRYYNYTPIEDRTKSSKRHSHKKDERLIWKEYDYKKRDNVRKMSDSELINRYRASSSYKKKKAMKIVAIVGGVTAAAVVGLYLYNKSNDSTINMSNILFTHTKSKDPEVIADIAKGAVPIPQKLFDRRLWDSFSDDEQGSIWHYTGPYYKYMNGILRNGDEDGIASSYKIYGRSMEDRIGDITTALNKSILDRDVTTYRMTNSSNLSSMFSGIDLTDKNNLLGKTFMDKGFVSSSPGKPKHFFGDLQLTICVPKGSKGLYINGESQIPSEQELLLQRNSVFKVKDVIFGSSGSIEEIVVDLVDQLI